MDAVLLYMYPFKYFIELIIKLKTTGVLIVSGYKRRNDLWLPWHLPKQSVCLSEGSSGVPLSQEAIVGFISGQLLSSLWYSLSWKGWENSQTITSLRKQIWIFCSQVSCQAMIWSLYQHHTCWWPLAALGRYIIPWSQWLSILSTTVFFFYFYSFYREVEVVVCTAPHLWGTKRLKFLIPV